VANYLIVQSPPNQRDASEEQSTAKNEQIRAKCAPKCLLSFVLINELIVWVKSSEAFCYDADADDDKKISDNAGHRCHLFGSVIWSIELPNSVILNETSASLIDII